MRKSAPGFTLVELLVVIAIIAILAAVVVLIINPLEITRRARDTSRLADLDNLQKAINTALTDSSTPDTLLCYNLTLPCSGNSNDVGPNTRKNDGTGWVKVRFSAQVTLSVSVLPADPSNNATYHYSYYSDGTSYELNATLESTQYKPKAGTDGGDNNNIYEVGSALTLLH